MDSRQLAHARACGTLEIPATPGPTAPVSMQAIQPIKRGDPRANRGNSRGIAPDAGGARLFLALWPEEPVRQALLACRDAWQWGRNAGKVPARHLHLTVHFLGEVPRARVPELTRGLAVPVTPFELVLAPLAVWPNGVAVWEAAACPAELTRLHDQLSRALVRLDVPLEERPYRPHVTLARRARDAAPPACVPPLSWPVDHYALVESCPGVPRRYEVLRTYR